MENNPTHQKEVKTPSLFISFLPIGLLISLLAINVSFYGADASYGPNQLALLISAALAACLATILGWKWHDIQSGIVRSIKTSLPAVIILLIIGALIGTWMISGIVPSMIYYGLKIMSPTYFLVSSCIVCSIISVATGSSWTTVSTVGVALIGIAHGLGINPGMAAGAIISGAYFGDKLSPLSDTTNLAASVAGTDLFTHIKYMLNTTIPTYTITLILFLILGFTSTSTAEVNQVGTLLATLDETYFISPILFIIPLIVIGLIIMKIDAVPALMIGTIGGAIFAIIFQPDIIKKVSGLATEAESLGGYIKHSYTACINAMASEVGLETPNQDINNLIQTGGMASMMNTIWLILCAMTFGGAMEVSGFLFRITNFIIRFAKSTGSLIATTITTCFFFNITTSDQYLSIVVPGKMFKQTYQDRGLKPEVLSRSIEDSGTVTSPLVPWNTCASYHSGMLNVSTGDYFIYAFFNWISPLMSIIFGYFNIKIRKLEPTDKMEVNS